MIGHLNHQLQQPTLGDTFAAGLAGYEWSKRLEPHYRRLLATEKTIVECLDGKQLLSTELWDICFPRATGQGYWHYTTLDHLDAIVGTREIWLHSLSMRMGEGELKEFPAEFGFDGFLAVDEGLPTIYVLARDLFFLSLSDNDDPGDMWGYGEVRLKLRVQPVASRVDLRRMAYKTDPDHPVRVLRNFAMQRYGRHFIPWQVSRQGAFLLDNYFSWESEVRLLVKRFSDSNDLSIRQSGNSEAVAIPLLADNERARIDLLAVEVESAADLARAKAILEEHVPDWGVQLIVSGS